MSHALRRMQRPSQTHRRIIRDDELSTFWSEGRLPSPLEQADNLILLIGEKQPTPSTWVDFTQSEIAAMIGIAVSADGNDSGGFSWLNSQLEPKKLYRFHPSPPGGVVRVMPEMPGWEKYEVLKKQRIESRTAFMALIFGLPIVTRMVDECVRPAVERTGFRLRILTDPQDAGLIDDKIRAGLLAARFVISDLTGGSHGAYWEAGFGEGRGIPVIYMCEKAEWTKNKTHFDTNHMATIIWDIDDLKKSQDALVAMIRATLAVRLCNGVVGAVNTFDGELTHVGVVYNYTPEALTAVQRMYPMPPSRQQLTGRAILRRTIVHIPDLLSDPEYAPDIALAVGWRGGLAVPMIRNDVVVGVILVMGIRGDVQPPLP
jgi:hypothetical protein